MSIDTRERETGPAPNTPEWYAARRMGIGGSDAAAVVGLSHWKTPLEVYLDKIGQDVDNETPDKRRGKVLEPAIRQMYTDETGRAVVVPDLPSIHPAMSFVRANLDGLDPGRLIIECKTARNRTEWGEPGTDEIPIVYLCQVQHNMLAAQLPRCDVAVLFGDFEFAIYPIEADQEFQDLLLEQEAEFWRCVERRIPPEPVTADDLQRRWPRHIVDAVVANSRDLVAARVLSAAKSHIKVLEALEEEAETILKTSIRDAEGLHVGGDLLCTWRACKAGTRFDAKWFQSEHPELYSKYLVDSAPQRRFLLKENCPCLSTKTDTILPPIPANLIPALVPPQEPA